MKTNSKARRLWKARGLLLVLLLGVISVLEPGLSQSLAARFSQRTTVYKEVCPLPTTSLADIMAAAH